MRGGGLLAHMRRALQLLRVPAAVLYTPPPFRHKSRESVYRTKASQPFFPAAIAAARHVAYFLYLCSQFSAGATRNQGVWGCPLVVLGAQNCERKQRKEADHDAWWKCVGVQQTGSVRKKPFLASEEG